jgi:hypothetical protein
MTVLMGFMDWTVNRNWELISSSYINLAQSVVPADSIFVSEAFLLSVYRYIISCCAVAAFFIFCFVEKLRFASLRRMLPSSLVLFLLAAVFIQMNMRSSNSDKVLYAVISFGSIVFLTFREHLIFGVQFFISRRPQEFWLTSALGLAVFILSHDLVLSYERFVATIFMINLWIYSTRVRSLWVATVMHLAWNWVLPDRADFHYFLFAVSFYLAFHPGDCPEQFRFIHGAAEKNKYLRFAWRPVQFSFGSVDYALNSTIKGTRRILAIFFSRLIR